MELFDVIEKLDGPMYSRAAEEKQQFGSTVPDPVAVPAYAHFEGLSQLCWNLTNLATSHEPHIAQQIVHAYKLGLETFVAFASVIPLSKIQRNGQPFSSSASFQETSLHYFLTFRSTWGTLSYSL